MKKNIHYILVFVLIMITVSCSQSRKNELIYKFTSQGEVACVDSLRSKLLDLRGIEFLIMYPDSDVVIIHYDRYRTHQDKIETHFAECKYSFELLEKSPIKGKQ